MNKAELLKLWSEDTTIVVVRGLQFDINKIRNWFKEKILPLPPAWQEGAYNLEKKIAPKIPISHSKNFRFGGWTVLGPSNTYDSGWFPNGYLPSSNLNIPMDFSDANIRTDVCTGPIAEFIDKLEETGIHLSRVRIAITKPGKGIAYHTDTNYPHELLVRIQFPIITNPSVYFHSKTQRWHLKDNGQVYIVNTNHLHKVDHTEGDLRFNMIGDIDISRLPDGDIYDLLPGEKTT